METNFLNLHDNYSSALEAVLLYYVESPVPIHLLSPPPAFMLRVINLHSQLTHKCQSVAGWGDIQTWHDILKMEYIFNSEMLTRGILYLCMKHYQKTIPDNTQMLITRPNIDVYKARLSQRLLFSGKASVLTETSWWWRRWLTFSPLGWFSANANSLFQFKVTVLYHVSQCQNIVRLNRFIYVCV